MSFARATNTVKAYTHGWKQFERWCIEAGRDPLPAHPSTVLDFITFRLATRRYRLATIRIELHAIQFEHRRQHMPNPVRPEVKELLRNAGRMLQERPHHKRPLTPKHLRNICGDLGALETPIAKRDHALILIGFAAGWRRNELVSLMVSDLWFEEDRMFVQLGASKSDQDGSDGRIISIPPGQNPATCPITAMRNWLDARGEWRGPLFCQCDRKGRVLRKGIKGFTLNLRLKHHLALIGENSTAYGAHSLRAGMATAAAEAGATEIAIMQRGGWKSLAMVARYVRPVRAFGVDPLKGVL